jgi:hypothetical protein
MELRKSAQEVISSQLFTVMVIVVTSIAFAITFIVLANILQNDGKLIVNEAENPSQGQVSPTPMQSNQEYSFVLSQVPNNQIIAAAVTTTNICQPQNFDPKTSQSTKKTQQFVVPEVYYEVTEATKTFTYTKNGYAVENSDKPTITAPLSADVYSFFCENGEPSYVIEITKPGIRRNTIDRVALLTQVSSYHFVDASTLYVVQLIKNGQSWEKHAYVISLPNMQKKNVPVSLSCMEGSTITVGNVLALAAKITDGKPREAGKFPTSLCFVKKDGTISAMATTELTWDGKNQNTPMFQLLPAQEENTVGIFDVYTNQGKQSCLVIAQSLTNQEAKRQFSLDKISLGASQKYCPRIQFVPSELTLESEALKYRSESFDQISRQLSLSEWHSSTSIK